MQNWFKDWFGSKEYLNVYNHRNNEDAEKLINTILDNVNISEDAEILDAACGSGRHSILLARKGFRVTAFDLSEELLKVAKKNAADENLIIEFIEADIREFSIDKKFSLVLNVFTSFGYFEDDTENFSFFDKLNKLLFKDGYFVFDYLNQNFVTENLIPNSEKEINGKNIFEERTIEKGRVVKKITIDSGTEKKEFYESVKLYSPKKIIERIEAGKLEVENIFGNYSGDSFDENKSERLIILARK